MRTVKVLLGAAVLAAGLGLVPASPAQAATPTCTSWTTYRVSQLFQQHVPSAGYQTGATFCILRQGNRNDAVKVLQRALRYCHGYVISIDGDFGPQTRAAVLNMQQVYNSSYGGNLAEDGEYGPETNTITKFPLWTYPANTRSAICNFSP